MLYLGIDTQPIVVPLREFGKELSRSLPSLPHIPPLVSAPDARLLVSWWNTEVRIWRVKPQVDGTEKPKVVARLALQGEENITSVSISRDGGILAVATASVVKLFQLLHSQSGFGAGLRIRKLEMPAVAGARMVRLAANGKWLTTVGAANDIRLARIVRTDDLDEAPRVLDKLHHLHRLHREDTPGPLDGPSGFYGRSITHVDFSGDGNVLAVVDLMGYIDTWVIEGHEDSTALEVDIDDSASPAAEDDDSDDEDEDETRQQITYLGQRWIRNPSGHLLPRLNSIPVLLSFQPSSDGSTRPQPNGNPAVHPTRHNPHPHSHDLPTTESRLLVVSAEHQLYLFDVMSGRLSEWSRRNPPSSYPREYRQLDLPAKGCVWDVVESQERVWLYGEKWLFMFDLTKDFPISDADNSSKKRKREAVKTSSGAGNAIPQKEAPVTKMRKFQDDQKDASGRSKWMDVNATAGNTTRDDDDVEDNSQPLAVLRRSATQDGEQVDESLRNGEMEDVNNGGEVGVVAEQGKPWWHTFKYRPILGIMPISGDDSDHAPEVVLVERPSWDLDLPPRFVGTHEQ